MMAEVLNLQTNPIGLRLAELGQLQDGWLEGKGLRPTAEGLSWLAHSLEEYYPNELPQPLLFPTGEGGILAEWSAQPWALSLEIDLNLKVGFFHALHRGTDETAEALFPLSEKSNWEELFSLVSRFFDIISEPQSHPDPKSI